MAETRTKPDLAAWRVMLEEARTNAELTEVMRWTTGWPELTDEPRLTLLWVDLARVDPDLTDAELNIPVAGFTDGPPRTQDWRWLLAHRGSGFETLASVGYWATSYSSDKWDRRGDHARAALLAEAEDGNWRARAALACARKHRSPENLLSASVALYRRNLTRLLALGPAGVETLLGALWMEGSMEDLISGTEALLRD